MGFSSRDELAQDAARRHGLLPHQVEVRDDGTLTARGLDGTETSLGTWSRKSGGFAPPSYTAHPAR